MNLMYLLYFFIFLLFIVCLGYILWQRRSRATHPQLYLCLDGHTVRSRGEWMIDAVLQYLGIPHTYELPLQIRGRTLHPDFSLGHGILLEYWGLHTRLYLAQKKKKQELYQQGNYHLINIEDADLRNHLALLAAQLRPFQGVFPQFQAVLNQLPKR